MRLFWLAVLAFLPAREGWARAAMPAPPGMTTVHVSEASADTYAVPLSPVGAGASVTETRGGTVRWATFRGETPGTPLAAIEAMADDLTLADLRTELDCADTACGGFDFVLAIEVMRPPAMMLNPLDFHQRTVTGTNDAGGTVSVSMLASRFAGMTHVQTVTVVAAPPPMAPPPEPRPAGEPAPALAAPTADGGAAPPAGARLLEALERDGRVVLEGIDFDSAVADKALADAAVLDVVAELLIARPDLTVVAVGHSDDVGPLAPNVALSRERAASVVAALEARGVAPDRMSAEGAGWLAPVTANTTPEGRAMNRRVELVLR